MNFPHNSKHSTGRNFGVGVWLLASLLVAGVVIWYAGGAIRTARAAAPSKSAQDGVYTAEQATLGKTAYNDSCGGCHMDDLSGSGQAPGLAGEAFSQFWDGRTVYDLYEVTRSTMPQDKPDSLGAEAYLGIVAYMLQANNYPAGKDKLKDDPDELKNITIGKKSSQ